MQPLRCGNLLTIGTPAGDGETVEVLLRRAGHAGARIERIVSTGQASPPGFWYDQDGGEFVVLLSGAARLRFDDGDRLLDMKPGDWVEIPAHVRHRVEFTQAEPPTVWLAVHVSG